MRIVVIGGSGHIGTYLSPRLAIDQSYMPYEFTITLWKDSTIRRPENLYAPV